MAVKYYKPTTNGRRNMSVLVFDEITTSTPEKSLLVSISKTGGRNNTGAITCRHIGGGHKRKYRIIRTHQAFYKRYGAYGLWNL